MSRLPAIAVAAAILSAGCSSTLNSPPIPVTHPSSAPQSKIQHVIVMLQENRSFNNLFRQFPGADTSTSGACKEYVNKQYHETFCKGGTVVTLHHITLETTGIIEGGHDIQHDHRGFEVEYDGGKMDGFAAMSNGTTGGSGGQPAGTYPYAYVVRREVQPYWDMAKRYVLGDHMFSTGTTDSFVAHQEIVAGTTRLNSHESLTDTPTQLPWGCDSTPGTKTAVIFTNGRVVFDGGPFPCLTQYKTMADVLDAAGISWKYYVQSYDSNSPYFDVSGEAWNGFDPIKSVRYGTDWNNVSIPDTNILKDVARGTLPQVSWVIPYVVNSDHPASGSNTGPSWVTSVVNAVGTSQYWKNTAIVVLWDDWGGFYDNVPPPQLDYTSLGMRVPMIVVSPFAKRHYVSKTQYEFGSVLKFIEQNFGTASLGSTDVRANSIVDVFNFGQRPDRFQTIDAPYGESYFLRRQPSRPAQQVIKADGGVPD
ncbi:MAG: alkaline phosphatase family protein [Candidatus Tumulicola sp.]